MMGPLVSVVIPVYNGGELLGEAVRSVFAQTYRRFELIVVDDASTDATADVLARFTDPRLKVLRHSANQGPSASRLAALNTSAGEIVAFLDQDDSFHDSKLECHVSFFEAHPEVGFTYNPHFTVLHPSATVVGIWRPPEPISLTDLVMGFPIPPSTWVMRREWALKDEIWDKKTLFRGREVVFCGRLFMAGCRFHLIDKVLNYRRIHVGRRFSDPASKCREERLCQAIVLDDPRCPPEVVAVRDAAAADNFLVWACVAFAQQEAAAGRDLLLEAVRLNPALSEGQPSRLLQSFVYHALTQAVDLEEQLRYLLTQSAPLLPGSPLSLRWALRHAHMVRGAQRAIWGGVEDGILHLKRALALGAEADELTLTTLCHELLSYEREFGVVAVRDAIARLEAALSMAGEKTFRRRLKGAYGLVRAFHWYRVGQYRGVPGAVTGALFRDPRHLRNRGAWSILLRAAIREFQRRASGLAESP